MSAQRAQIFLSTALVALLSLLGWVPQVPGAPAGQGTLGIEKSSAPAPAYGLKHDDARKAPEPWVPTLDLLQPEGWHLALVFIALSNVEFAEQQRLPCYVGIGRGRGPPAA